MPEGDLESYISDLAEDIAEADGVYRGDSYYQDALQSLSASEEELESRTLRCGANT